MRDREVRHVVAEVDPDADDDLLSVCVQHELDHLMGKVFVEYLSVLKRERIRSRLRKQQREALKAGQ